jgi:DUF1680 family protein
MKSLIFVPFTVIILFAAACNKGPRVSEYPIKSVNQKNIRVTDALWKERIKTVQDITIPYGFRKCEEKGRFDNFLIAGGKMEGPVKGKMPFDDTDPYKIIEGASYAMMNDEVPELSSYVDSVISIIATGQEGDGYITTWKTIDPQNPPADWCPPGGRWENLSTSHELYNSGHLYHAAATHYKASKNKDLLYLATQNANLLNQVFGPDKLTIPPGHQVVESGLIRLYQITGEFDYLDLAKYFLDSRGDSTTHELYGPYSQDHKPVIRQDEAVGHAVRAVYMYAAMTDIAALYDNPAYKKAVHDLWNNVVHKKMYVTGGLGAKHQGESFGENYELPNLTAYSETCAAIGFVMWNYKMFLLTGDAKYMDVLERTLYNGLLSGLSLSGNRFFYPNPLESDNKYKFNRGALSRKPWFDCSCCPTNLMRFIPSLPKYVYAQKSDTLYINLFMDNQAEFTINGSKISLIQTTDYPWNGNISIEVKGKEAGPFTLKIRMPGWTRNQPVPGDLYSYKNHFERAPKVLMNGEIMDHSLQKGYITITREWKKRDKISLNFPMPVRQVVAHQKVRADSGKVALERGPIVYCAETADNEGRVFGFRIPENPEFSSQYLEGELSGIQTISSMLPVQSGEQKGPYKASFTAIPYYSWSNRGPGRMRVWFPEMNKND